MQCVANEFFVDMENIYIIFIFTMKTKVSKNTIEFTKRARNCYKVFGVKNLKEFLLHLGYSKSTTNHIYGYGVSKKLLCTLALVEKVVALQKENEALKKELESDRERHYQVVMDLLNENKSLKEKRK